MLETGALDEAKRSSAATWTGATSVGQVVAQEGPVNASTDNFKIELIGAGAHAARPHESADPIVGAAALITALQTLVSRRLDPGDSRAWSPWERSHAGTADNIIPDRAELTGTMRAVTRASRDLLMEELKRVSDPRGPGAPAEGRRCFRSGHTAGGEPGRAGWLGPRGGEERAGREGAGAARRHQHGRRGLRLLPGADAGLLSPDRRAGAGRSLAAGALTRVLRGGGKHLHRRGGSGGDGPASRHRQRSEPRRQPPRSTWPALAPV